MSVWSVLHTPMAAPCCHIHCKVQTLWRTLTFKCTVSAQFTDDDVVVTVLHLKYNLLWAQWEKLEELHIVTPRYISLPSTTSNASGLVYQNHCFWTFEILSSKVRNIKGYYLGGAASYYITYVTFVGNSHLGNAVSKIETWCLLEIQIEYLHLHLDLKLQDLPPSRAR